MIARFLKRLAEHKTLVIVTVLVLGGGTIWYVRSRTPVMPPRYVLASVTRGALVTSITASGQVSGKNQIDLKPNVSGVITKILVKAGDEVKANTPLVEIDPKTANKAVRDAAQSVADARLSLASAEIALQKLKAPPDAVALTQAQNSLNQAKRDLASLEAGADPLDIKEAENALASAQASSKISSDGVTPQVVRDAYDDTVATLKTTSEALEEALYDADTILGIDKTGLNDAYEKYLSVLDSSKLTLANAAYPGAKQAVSALKTMAEALPSTNADIAQINTAMAQAQTSASLLGPLLDLVQDVLTNSVSGSSFTQTSLDSLRSTIQSSRSSVATKAASLVTQAQGIQSAKDSYVSAQLNVEKAQNTLDKLKKGSDPKDISKAQETVKAAEASLAKLQKGTDPLDIQTSENSLAQRRSSIADALHKLADAQETLKDYVIRAPFDGVVAQVPVHVSDQASPSTILAVLLTKAKIAPVSLNEVDVAKVKTDQKATLTFDAIPDLTIAGVVSEIDSIGTVTQGVVNYTVKIAFVTEDERVKPGMSVSASIVTDMRSDVLSVPNAAVRRDTGGTASVQMIADLVGQNALDPAGVTSSAPPTSHGVEVGLSNDQQTEITSGLNEGDYVVTRTIDANAAATAGATTPGTIRIPGLSGGAGAATRFGR